MAAIGWAVLGLAVALGAGNLAHALAGSPKYRGAVTPILAGVALVGTAAGALMIAGGN